MTERRYGVSAAAILTAALMVSPGFAQDTDLRDEIEALKKGQQEIQKQLAEVMKLLKQRPAAPAQPARRGPQVEGKVFTLGANPVEGESTAKLTLIEFSDYQ
jgi:protein-disulfide isomerase